MGLGSPDGIWNVRPVRRKRRELRGFFRFAQRIHRVAEDGAMQPQQNTTYCGSSLTCTTDSGIFASAVVNKR